MKSLFAMHNYGHLHHAYRLQWGFLDEMLPVGWAHRDERSLLSLMREAQRTGREPRIVSGTAPGWEEPWSRAVRCRVPQGGGFWPRLVTEHGFTVDDRDVQAAELPAP